MVCFPVFLATLVTKDDRSRRICNEVEIITYDFIRASLGNIQRCEDPPNVGLHSDHVRRTSMEFMCLGIAKAFDQNPPSSSLWR